MAKKADMIIDLQFGSTGKGLIAGYLAETNGYDTVINANMPNAGHTYINAAGREWIHKVLPNGIVSPNLKRVMIGPGSIFSPDRFIEEYLGSEDILDQPDVNIYIHPDAAVLRPEHAEVERQNLNVISSTMQGSAAAMIEKIMRQKDKDPRAKIALRGTELYRFVCTHQEWNNALEEADNILIEGAQGYSLGLNAGFWPYCTSRDCTPARFLSDCGVPHSFLRYVIGTARTYPIRVGSTPGGHSGDCYPDQNETQWADVGQQAETTTVTGRVRRVFTFSQIQIREAIQACRPDFIFLNFCNYFNSSEKVYRLIETIEYEGDKINGVVVGWTGWGPRINNVKQEALI